MNQFFKKIFFFSLPIILIFAFVFGLYIYLDPFKVVKTYSNYYPNNEPFQIITNKDFVSTMNFLNKYKDEKYNSFIFGNSRSMVYHKNEWLKYLPSNANVYHFDAFGETLFGIYRKFKLLDKLNVSIDNAIIILDNSEQLSQTYKNDEKRILFSMAPALINNNNFIKFHLSFFKAFCQPKFLYAYVYFRIHNNIQPWMKEFFSTYKISYDSISNEVCFSEQESKIEKGTYYDDEHTKDFFHPNFLHVRNNLFEYDFSIYNESLRMLEDISKILRKHSTSYKVIISPLYYQIKLNSADINALNMLFGKENVWDFSGHNLLTEDYHNYYENSHYRPIVANKIMSIVYNTDSIKQKMQLDSLFCY